MHYNTGQDFVRETKCIPHCLLFHCKTGWQHCSVTAKTPLDILQTHRCTVSHHQCTTTLVRTLSEKQNAFLTAFCFSAKQADSIVVSLQRHLWIFLKHTDVQCPITNALQHWSALVLGHCTPIWWANTQRSICSDTTMMSACYAEKQKAVRNAFCPDQCCSTLVLGHCTPVWWADILRCLCSDTTMLSACFAEQHRTVRNAFCLDQCCRGQNAFLTAFCFSA